MGSVIVNHVPSEYIDSHYKMVGGTANPSDSIYRHSPHSSQTPLQTARSSSASSNTTPTSITAPPSTSTVGSGRLPAQSQNDLPAYISQQTPPDALARPTSNTPTSSHPPISSMTSTQSGHAYPSHTSSSTYAAQPQSGSHATSMADPMNTEPDGEVQPSPVSPRLRPMRSLAGSAANSPSSRIRVRSLSHIQSLASDEFLAQAPRSQVSGETSQDRQFEISSMPVTDIIEMVAGLLTKITTANDVHHERVHRHIPPPDGTSSLSPQATSVLAFHGKNVPSITILSYLTRIHKYCPTTYEVFLSLLVYFDRMTELVNRGKLKLIQRDWEPTTHADSPSDTVQALESAAARQTQPSAMVTPPSSTGMAASDPNSPSISPALYPQGEDENLSHFFVVDSFNIHRLVIAGVTCASKFFSDVFYTNSRYAKVGGLPLVELNHLELQFLLLNDFRLAIPVEELEAYGTMLVEFYAREVVTQQQQQQRPMDSSTASTTTTTDSSDAMYMRSSDKPPRSRPGVGQTPTPP
ncbi:cyclin-domain-containing protein [Penicillium lagena]|uniref:cyclin-domain-containing protein n=1 Tax=Penicillium lagena TaxID=94218 RepID=UPI002541317B|nr:cyclin-domain-containing protein [Penicillium lagena]KAJ5612927.1 cyclin-domain-containing protein [Penicillium lagena]